MSQHKPLSPQTLGDWLTEVENSPEVPWLVPNVIPRAGLVFVVAEPKVGQKTWLCFALGMGMATGRRVGDFEPTGKHRVLYLSLEGSAKQTAGRFPKLARGLGISTASASENFFILHGSRVDLDNPEHISEIMRFVLENRIDCVFIDTLSAAFLRDDNSSENVKVMLDRIHKIRDIGCAVVIVHHTTKSSRASEAPNPGMDMRGSSALAGAFDAILAVYELKVDDERSKWLLLRGKDFEDYAYKIEWRGIKEGRAELWLDRYDTYPIPDPPSKK